MKCSCMTKIGMLHNFANFWQRKGSQSETTEHIVTDFWDPIVPKKVPSVICATIAKKTGYYLWHFHVPWIFGTVFWHHIYNSWLFSFGNGNSRAFSNAIPHYKHPCKSADAERPLNSCQYSAVAKNNKIGLYFLFWGNDRGRRRWRKRKNKK